MDRQHKTTVITALRGKLLTLGLLFFAAAAITGCDTPENDVTAPKIVAGAAHACAFDADREQVVCWGDNSYGQLGNEEFSAEGVSAPVRVKVISGRKIKSLSAGYSHTCALVSGGDDNSKNTVACWGYNHYGQVGNGTFKDSNVPVFVNGPDGKPLTGVVNVSAGAYHTCASIVKGSPSDPSNYVATTYCWGRNDKGQIGNGALTNVNVPTEIKGLDYSSGVAAGTAHTCALTSKSTDDAQAKKYVVMCWGDASRGQMREAKVESGFSTKPVDIGLPLQGDDNGFPALFSEHIVQADVTTATGKQAEGEDALAVAPENSAYGQTCALSADQALCWGGSNQNGQWGTDKKDVTEFAVKTEEIVNGSSLKAYGAGNAQSCMLVGKGDDSSANEVACWGFTSSLGFAMPKDATDAVVADNRKPVPLQGLRPTGLAVGREFVCYAAKGEQPQIWCWGTGKKGQIGNGTIKNTRIPQCVKGYCPETKKNENLVEGQPFADAPGAAPFVVQVSAGYLGTCAVIAGGTVKCWGDAAFHDFRDSWTHYENWADREYPLPVDVDDLGATALNVQTGAYSVCATILGGSVKCWGNPGLYRPVDFDPEYGGYTRPELVAGWGPNIKALRVGPFGRCAMLQNNSVECLLENGERTLSVSGTNPLLVGFNGWRPCVLNAGSVKCSDLAVTQLEDQVGFTSGVTTFGAGFYGMCGAFSDDRVECSLSTASGRDVSSTIHGLPPLQSIHVGRRHVCVLTKTGGVKCWGTGGNGELGNGKLESSDTPVDVEGLQAGVQQVSTQGDHTCALLVGGLVKCWGYNSGGQLGDGTKRNSGVPVLVNFGGRYGARGDVVAETDDLKEGDEQAKVTVMQPLGVASVQINFHATDANAGAGFTYQCSLDGGAAAGCASGDTFGPVAGEGAHSVVVTAYDAANNPATTAATIAWSYYIPPVTTLDPSGPTQGGTINSGTAAFTFDSPTATSYECRIDGGAWTTCTSPANYAGLDDGEHTFEVRAVRNGVPDTNTSTRTWTVDTTPPATTITASQANDAEGASYSVSFTCGEAGCSFECKLDTGSYATCTSPYTATVATAGEHTVMVRAYDALGNVDLTPATATWNATVGGGGGASVVTGATISAGGAHACAISSGAMYCWGFAGSQLGELVGPPELNGAYLPTQMGSLTDWVSVSAAGSSTHTCGIRSSGELYCWGANSNGQLGDPNADPYAGSAAPVQVAPGQTWHKVAAIDQHTCAIRDDQSLWCWGSNGSGELGLGFVGDFEIGYNVTVPTQVGSATNWIDVGGGYSSTCALNANGDMYCWGMNSMGQLGVGTMDSFSAPLTAAATNVRAMTAGGEFACAVYNDGSLWCWGDNNVSQGGNAVSDRTLPSRVGTATDWATVEAGITHTCAIRTDGSRWCWGDWANNALGDDNALSDTQATPVKIGGETDWLELSCSQQYCIGVRDTVGKDVFSWGDNQFNRAGVNADLYPVVSPMAQLTPY